MNDWTEQVLVRVASEFGTPAYVYFLDKVLDRVGDLRKAFGGRFGLSFAMKSNPNRAVLEALHPVIDGLDASSLGEVDRGLRAGYAPTRISFSGPAKRDHELQEAVGVGCGLMVAESPIECRKLGELGRKAGRRIPVAPRINPFRVPRLFGVRMAGKPSQFGIDEEDLETLASDPIWRSLDLKGFHIYSGTNSLNEEAIAENFSIFIDLFRRFSDVFGIAPAVLVFGSGFGIPYHDDQVPLQIPKLASLINPLIDQLKGWTPFRDTKCVLEMGRYLVGPAGYFLTRVVNQKRSRGTDICVCDGGFNNHLAAFGLMGTVIRRNWSMWNISAKATETRNRYMVVGPLCTTIDTLAQDVELRRVRTGDVIAVGSSGAYGLTASPLFFISHPPPKEIVVRTSGSEITLKDVTDLHSGTVAAR